MDVAVFGTLGQAARIAGWSVQGSAQASAPGENSNGEASYIQLPTSSHTKPAVTACSVAGVVSSGLRLICEMRGRSRFWPRSLHTRGAAARSRMRRLRKTAARRFVDCGGEGTLQGRIGWLRSCRRPTPVSQTQRMLQDSRRSLQRRRCIATPPSGAPRDQVSAPEPSLSQDVTP